MTFTTAPQPTGPHQPKRRRFLTRATLTVAMSAAALLLSVVAVANSGHTGPAGPPGVQGSSGTQGQQGPAGQQGPQGPRGHTGSAGATGGSSGSGTGSGPEPGISPAANQRQQACIDTYTGSLTPAQINQYCAPGGALY